MQGTSGLTLLLMQGCAAGLLQSAKLLRSSF
jgi:hypothetical protein